MTFKDSLKITQLDFSKLILEPSSGSQGNGSEFDITPKDFLKYAKEDLKAKHDRGTINGLSNAKRAIDCQIDEVLYNLGIDSQKLPKALDTFVNYFDFEDNIPYKLKIVQGLNLAPSATIAKSRNLRNKLEHFYKIPTIEEVRDAIDIADLFIRSVDGKCKMPMSEFILADDKYYEDGGSSSYIIDYDFSHKKFRIRCFSQKGQHDVIVTINDPEFFAFIRMMYSIDDDELTESSRVLAKLIDHPIPLKNIAMEQR